MQILYIALLGLSGVMSRYAVNLLVERYWAISLPLATFLVNILGCFLIGFIYVLGVERGMLSMELRLGMMVGFLGGFTTFSSYALELTHMLEKSQYMMASLYFFLSTLVGLLATVLGLYIGRMVWAHVSTP